MRFDRSFFVFVFAALLAVGCGSNNNAPAPVPGPAPAAGPAPAPGGGIGGGLEVSAPGTPFLQMPNQRDALMAMTQNLQAFGGTANVQADVGVQYSLQGNQVAPIGAPQPQPIAIPYFSYAGGSGYNGSLSITLTPRSSGNYIPQGNPYLPGNVGGLGGRFEFQPMVSLGGGWGGYGGGYTLFSTDQVALFVCTTCAGGQLELLRVGYRSQNPVIQYFVVDPLAPQFYADMKTIATTLSYQGFGQNPVYQPFGGY